MNARIGHHEDSIPDNQGFVEGHIEPAVDFDWGAVESESEIQKREAAVDALEAIRIAILLIAESGTAEEKGVRVVALARLAGLFESDGAAAKKADVNRTTILRAVRTLREEITRTVEARAHPKIENKPIK